MKTKRFPRWLIAIVLMPAALVAIGAAAGWLMLRASLPVLDGRVRGNGLSAAVTIDRDALGVPTISGADRGDLAYATGFLHAQDRFFQMDLLRRAAAGELSELLGPAALDLDRRHRLHSPIRTRRGMPPGISCRLAAPGTWPESAIPPWHVACASVGGRNMRANY